MGLAEISGGKFQPTSIVDTYEYDENSEFSFELNDIRYETTLQNVADWLDLTFLELINGALKENAIDGQFYSFAGEGQFVVLIFLTEDQFTEIQRGQLLTLLEVGNSTAVEEGQEFEQQVLEEIKKNE